MTKGRTPRIYADTSVFGGVFDTEFTEASERFFAAVRNGSIRLILSDVVARELAEAPDRVQRLLLDLPPAHVERISEQDESLALRDAYLADGVVGRRWEGDAMHVAVATVCRADVLVSWNFRHLVRLDRIRGFNAANLRLGYAQIEIRSPMEVAYETEEDV